MLYNHRAHFMGLINPENHENWTPWKIFPLYRVPCLMVCSDRICFFNNDGSVGANAVGGSFYGYSPAGIVLENVMCEGFESSLFGCSSPPLGRVLSPQCLNPSTDAAGVMCLLRQGTTTNSVVTCHILKLYVLRHLDVHFVVYNNIFSGI